MGLYLFSKPLLSAMNSLKDTQNGLDTVYQRLSTGKRINSAKDDPAGFMISSRLTSEINGLQQGSRNASDGIAFAQTVEGALDEVTTILQRIRTLAIQSANGTNTTDDRQALTKEAEALSNEINRIFNKTTYAGSKIFVANNGTDKTLMDGNGEIKIQVGAYADDTISIRLDRNGYSLSKIGANYNFDENSDGFVIKNNELCFALSTAKDAEAVIDAVDYFLKAVDGTRGDLGAVMSRLESAIRINDNTRVNVADARSRIMDTDYAEETANLISLQIKQSAAISVMKMLRSQQSMILSLLQQ